MRAGGWIFIHLNLFKCKKLLIFAYYTNSDTSVADRKLFIIIMQASDYLIASRIVTDINSFKTK